MDLAAAIFVLVDRRKPSREREQEVYAALTGALRNGYTYRDIHDKILNASRQNIPLDFSQFSRKVVGNLMDGTGATRYYHPELTIHNTLNPVIEDIDAGTHATSKKNVFWIEPRASYTMDDLQNYFYSKQMVDTVSYPPGRVRGILSHFVERYYLEPTLFMIDCAAAVYQETKKKFDLKTFDDYRSAALERIETAKNHCVYSGGANYVNRPRVLFG